MALHAASVHSAVVDDEAAELDWLDERVLLEVVLAPDALVLAPELVGLPLIIAEATTLAATGPGPLLQAIYVPCSPVNVGHWLSAILTASRVSSRADTRYWPGPCRKSTPHWQ
jgi:hypothetical protein